MAPSRSNWRERAAQRGERDHLARVAEARRAWRALGKGPRGHERQSKLVREIVDTRSSEFRRGWHDLQGVGEGVRIKGNRVRHEPAVVLIVERKRAKGSRKIERGQLLPTEFLTYATVERRRRLVAVPTDVRDGAGATGFRAHISDRKTVRARSIQGAVLGVPSVALRIRKPNGDLDPTRFLLSCLHVFGVTKFDHPTYPDARIEERSGAEFARLSRFVGFLIGSDLGLSHDAAIAQLDDRTVARRVCPVQPTRIARSLSQIPARYRIWTGRGTVSARWTANYGEGEIRVGYEAPGPGFDAAHTVLVESRADTRPGDSGSPVVSTDGATLLGMHIAGKRDRALMIPAWEMLRAENYRGLSSGHRITLDSRL